jgi:hypothetical protein
MNYSKPSKTSKPEVLKKTKMKNKIEWTRFLAHITITLETKAILEKTEKSIIVILLSPLYHLL